ncbi:hypothetical protein C4J81_03825 [Deltaproteobacteria bacterium Smac51]|nr:hypothetical protein C4J81_03825 [Deltaproteobacteria bacterium Smac51]
MKLPGREYEKITSDVRNFFARPAGFYLCRSHAIAQLHLFRAAWYLSRLLVVLYYGRLMKIPVSGGKK